MVSWLTWLRTGWTRVAALFSKARLDRDFDEELESHLALAIDAARRRGLTPDEARREALHRLGGLEPIKELHRDTRGLPFVETLLQDLRYGARTLRKTPGLTLVVIASLALGIGANMAVFTLINAVLLCALPVPQPDALVRLTATPVLSFPMYRDLRAAQTVFTDIFGSTMEWPVRVTILDASGSTPIAAIDNAPTLFVTPSYFPVLGITPQIGRFFTEAEDRVPESAESSGSVVVISDAFWARHFNRDPGVLGRSVSVNRSQCRIIGVAPRGFAGERVGTLIDAWVPLTSFSPVPYLEERRGMFTASVARLRPGVTLEQAERAITTVYQRLLEQQWRDHPGTRQFLSSPNQVTVARSASELRLRLTRISTGLETPLRATFSRPLWLVMAIVALVLLIACANVANLLLARSAWRRREFGLRLALGCSRARLIRQLLTESVLLAALGATAGILLAWWGSHALALMADARDLDLRPDLRVLGFLLAMTLLTGLGFGIAPAWQAGRTDLAPGLNEQGRGGSAPGRQVRQRLSRTLVTTQVALSLLLLVGAGLLIRSLYNLRQVDLGFRPEQVVVFGVGKQVRDPLRRETRARMMRELHDQVRAIPGVRAASVSSRLLFGGSEWYIPLQIPDHAPSLERPVMVHFDHVMPGYFETFGMTLLQGRTIDDRDSEGQPRVAVINQALARKYFPERPPLGRTVTIGVNVAAETLQIVGVVRDAKYNDVRSEAVPMIYLAGRQSPTAPRAIAVRTTEPVGAMAEAVRQAVVRTAPSLIIERVSTLSDQVEQTLAPERLIATLGLVFGGIALLLASIGLYGVMSYSVARRTGEIGIRMALGATGARVRWLILRQSLIVVLGGLAAGLVAAWLATRSIEGFLYGVTRTDARTIAGATILLVAVAALAAWLPARRATRVDPMVALRHE